MLELTILAENTAKICSHLRGEHGLSIYLKCNDLNILFDTGQSDLYLQNAAKLGVSEDLKKLDWIIFSHHHYDHVDGLKYFPHPRHEIKLLAQKYAFYQRIGETNTLSDANLLSKYNMIAADSEPIDLNQDLVFLARIPRLNDFECQNSYYDEKVQLPSGKIEEDFYIEDSALVYKSFDGIVVITGCSHSGICNIVHYAKQIAEKKWGISNVKTVIGGLHLIDADADFLQKTINLLKEYGVSEICPCHCTDLAARIALAKSGFQVNEANSGTVLRFS